MEFKSSKVHFPWDLKTAGASRLRASHERYNKKVISCIFHVLFYRTVHKYNSFLIEFCLYKKNTHGGRRGGRRGPFQDPMENELLNF